MENKTGYQLEVKKAFEQIEVGVRGVFESENYKNYLRIMAKFHRYSVNNSILIMMQSGGSATQVTGASKWASMNRTIKKGAKALKILIPHPYKKEIVVMDENGNEKVEEKEFVYFTLGNVFDISQTEGEELPEICKELEGNSDEIKELTSILQKVSKVPIYFWNLKDGSKGFYSTKDNKIVIKKGMSDTQTFKTLIHEVAHSRMHMAGYNVQKAELEAESIAYVVCNHFGIDSSEYSFEYLANWSKDKELKDLKAILSNIQGQAKNVIEEMEELILKGREEN